MSRKGTKHSLLARKHYGECSGQTFSKCQPFTYQDGSMGVVFMEWCGGCGAADYEVV